VSGDSPSTGAAPDETGADASVLVAGETLVDFVPGSTGPLADVESFDRRPGGAPANVAVALARLHDPPLFWTRVGADPFGDFLAERLDSEGIPARFVERDPGAHTTLAFVSRGESEPRFTFYREGTADTRLEPGTVPDATLDAVEWVHVGGVSLAAEPARSATLDLVDRAADRGCTVSFDPNVRQELWANDAELATVCGWMLDAADVLVATPGELRALDVVGGGASGSDAAGDGLDSHGQVRRRAEALAHPATDSGPHTVVLTLGEAGAVAVATDSAPWPGTATHAGFDVDAVDPTGAGDAFAAGLLDALRRDCALSDALAFASGVGALATTDRGAMAALPARDAVTALVAE